MPSCCKKRRHQAGQGATDAGQSRSRPGEAESPLLRRLSPRSTAWSPGANVNPGNNVIAGQSLMAIRSLTEIWIDANFKETQLANLRIGQPVDLDVDMYGSHQHVQGPHLRLHHGHRLDAGPAAAGKRHGQLRQSRAAAAGADRSGGTTIPDKGRCSSGCRSRPYVHINEQPTGPDAGKVLQPVTSSPEADHVADRRRRRSHEHRGDWRRDGIVIGGPTSQRPRSINPWLVAVAVVDADLHGSAGHDDRQRGAALHRRRVVGRR